MLGIRTHIPQPCRCLTHIGAWAGKLALETYTSSCCSLSSCHRWLEFYSLVKITSSVVSFVAPLGPEAFIGSWSHCGSQHLLSSQLHYYVRDSQYLMKKNNLMLWIHQSCSVFKRWNRNNWMKNQSKRREKSEMATNARIGTPTDKDQRPYFKLCATLLWMSCEWLRLVYALDH